MEKRGITDILVIGDLNIDYLGMVPFFPAPDEEVAIDPLESYLGGSGANFSVVARRMGLTIDFRSAVGNDVLGSNLIRLLEMNGVPANHVKVIDGVVSGLVFGAVEKSGVRRLFCYRGANLGLSSADIRNDALNAVQWMHLNGPVYSLALDLLTRGRKLNLRTSIDPGSILIEEHNIDHLLPLADILFLSEVEFHKISRGQSLIDKANYLHQKGANWIVLKHGIKGCALFRKGMPPAIQNAYEIQAVDTTGAGDAYNAGFIYGILRELEVSEVLKMANAVGALASLSRGATSGVPLSIEEIELFILNTQQYSTSIVLE